MDLLEKHPTPHPQVASRIVDGEALIVLADSGEVTVLNKVGSRIWELVDGSRSVQGIVETIEAEYDTTREQAEQDVVRFVQELIDNKMLLVD
ncbi:MAG: pyrroloquinoline quinone biosynthesis peptide chaperone PqqD [Acidobacteria bacterium]|nr:pyrroloquinoline quinone biosynthesis peptide chaperone PqqD [Acidobacteriota bacterium]